MLEISYPEGGKRAHVRHVKLHPEFVRSVPKKYKINKNNTFIKNALKSKKSASTADLSKFIKKIFTVILNVKISRQQNIDPNHSPDLDYRCCLVLLKLLMESDAFGIVMNCGTPEIGQFSGLSKQAIYRALHQLKTLGLIRSHAEGGIHVGFINTTAPIYALNLSHSLWGESALYGRFLILEYPQQHVFEVQKIASLFSMIEQVDHLDPELPTRELLFDLSTKLQRFNGFYLRSNPLCLMEPTNDKLDEILNIRQPKWRDPHLIEGIEHYFQLKSFFPKNKLRASFGITNEENILVVSKKRRDYPKLNGFYHRLGVLQSILEQWGSQIYSRQFGLYKLLEQGNLVSINDVILAQVIPKALIGSYDISDKAYLSYETNKRCLSDGLSHDEISDFTNQMDAEKDESPQVNPNYQMRREYEAVQLRIFLGELIKLIAANQIYFFQKMLKSLVENQQAESPLSRGTSDHITQFRILPRAFENRQYTVFFVPQCELTQNEYFFTKLKQFDHRFDEFAGGCLEVVASQVQSISPTLTELQKYGLMHQACKHY
ncbi:hypothetical protein KWE92_03930 [Acinetobacter pittii]|uniref:hypothetical protein n=1 Tax=Acinetobacter pittii TaxID=48296 RepID=UPI00355BC293